MNGVIDAYIEYRTPDLGTDSLATLGYRLRALLRVGERDRLLSQLTTAIADELYAKRITEAKPDTHRAELGATTAMMAWCIKRGWLAANPFTAVEPVGRKTVRRTHLRINEARAFLAAAKNDASDAGLACAMALLMGLRATELTSLLVRDIDDGARVLWVDAQRTKTEAGERHLEVPTELRKRLQRRIAKRGADEKLFGDVDRHWLHHHTGRICGLAEIATVSPHALRRTWSALAAEVLPIDAVSIALGQRRDGGVNRRHYQPGNAEQRRQGRSVAAAVSESGNQKRDPSFRSPKTRIPAGLTNGNSSCARGDSNPHSVTR